MFGSITGETPSYDVISKKNGYEIRRYQQYVVAKHSYEVSKDGEFSSKTSSGFMRLFGYISGENDTETKIAMTVPVVMQQTESDSSTKHTMAFIMSPSKFTSANQLPSANDKDVQIVEQSNSRDMACITFNMSMSAEKKTAKEKELRDAAKRDGIELSSDPNDVLYLGYNPPYTIPYFRRNEICIPIINQQ